MGRFAVVPEEVMKDRRLGKQDILVLISLLCHADKKSGKCWPKRESISADTGIRPQTISAVTSRLERLGWLKKTGKGGFSKSTTYVITVPDLSTVLKSSTVPESSTSTVPESSTSTVPESSTRKELTNKQTNEQTIKKQQVDFVGKPQSEKSEHGDNGEIEILSYLNKKTGANFRPVKSNITLIKARMKEGYSKDDLIGVIDLKTNDWIGDKKMKQFLRPSTLFGAKNCAQYVGQLGMEDAISKEEQDWLNDPGGDGISISGDSVINGEFERVK